MTNQKAEWELVNPKPLGGGGQSDVYLVRTPERTKQRARSREIIDAHRPMMTGTAEHMSQNNLEYVEAIHEYNRPDLLSELGAMKVFKLRNDEAQSLQRLKQEIAVLQENRPGLPKLLGSNVDERWMVTEYFPDGTLEDHLLEYKGNPALGLEDFRSVVKTTSLLHKEGIVHRDFKPANIFVRGYHELVLGDFGLVTCPIKLHVRRPTKVKPWERTISYRRGATWEYGLNSSGPISTCTCLARFFGAWSQVNPSLSENISTG